MCCASCCDPSLIYLINTPDLILSSQLGFPGSASDDCSLHPGTPVLHLPAAIAPKWTTRLGLLCTAAHQVSRTLWPRRVFDKWHCGCGVQKAYNGAFTTPLWPHWFICRVSWTSIDFIWGIKQESNHEYVWSSPEWSFYPDVVTVVLGHSPVLLEE